MTVPPQVNATLMKIARGGLSEDYDQTAETAPVRWAGEAGVYIDERLVTVPVGGGTLNRIMQTTCYFDPELLAVELGDYFTYEYRGQSFIRRVANLTIPRLPGAPEYGQAVLEVDGAR